VKQKTKRRPKLKTTFLSARLSDKDAALFRKAEKQGLTKTALLERALMPGESLLKLP
jgi:hypothetical protein